VGLLPGRGFVVNPTVEEQAESSLDLVMAGTSEAVLMIEGFCDFLSEEQMVEVGVGCCCCALRAVHGVRALLAAAGMAWEHCTRTCMQHLHSAYFAHCGTLLRCEQEQENSCQ
jgi:hypothetical protein